MRHGPRMQYEPDDAQRRARARRRLHAQRGQTLVESALFIPLLVLSLGALLFFGKLGVIAERSESAVRYGDLVSFRSGNAYSAAVVESTIDELLHASTSQLGPLCLEPTAAPNATPRAAAPIATIVPAATPAGATPMPTATPFAQSTSIADRVDADVKAALYQAQQPVATISAPPSALPFWAPSSVVQTPCGVGSIALQPGAFGVGNLPMSVQSIRVKAMLPVPTVVAPIVATLTCFASAGCTGAQGFPTGARIGFVNVATPNVVLGCIPGVGGAPGVNVAIAILQPSLAGKPGPVCPGAPTGT